MNMGELRLPLFEKIMAYLKATNESIKWKVESCYS
jgi:hypothetical protein